jgi:hypothetical protein
MYSKVGCSQSTSIAVPLIFHENTPLTFVGPPTGSLSDVENVKASLGTAFVTYGTRLVSSVQEKVGPEEIAEVGFATVTPA